MTSPTTTTTMVRKAPARGMRGRRGVAMLMVVIALVITTVLTSAVLMTPKNMDDIASNTQNAASARWSAESASNFTTSAIANTVAATEIGGLFKDDWSIANGNASVIVTNTLGETPTADDRTLLVTVTGTSNGISKTVQRVMKVQPPVEANGAVDARLSEFAVFGANALSLENTTIQPWAHSPDRAGACANIALGFDSVGGVAATGSKVYGSIVVGPSASSALVGWGASQKSKGVVELPVGLPRAIEPAPDVGGVERFELTPADILGGAPGAVGDLLALDISGAVDQLLTPGQYGDFTLSSGGSAEMGDGVYVFDRVEMKDGVELVVTGDVRLIVWDRLRIGAASRIRVVPGASLRLWIGNKLQMADAAISTSEITDPYDIGYYRRDNSYTDPSAILIEVASGGEVQLGAYSTLYASLHAPGADVRIEQSLVVGRVAGGTVSFSDSALWYDPAMDSGMGFADLDGPLYVDHQTPIDGLDTVVANASVMAPDDVNALLSTLVADRWANDGAPGATASGYWETETSVVADFASDSVWQREWQEIIASIKDRYDAGDDTEEEVADILANLRRHDDDGDD